MCVRCHLPISPTNLTYPPHLLLAAALIHFSTAARPVKMVSRTDGRMFELTHRLLSMDTVLAADPEVLCPVEALACKKKRAEADKLTLRVEEMRESLREAKASGFDYLQAGGDLQKECMYSPW